MVKTNNNNVSIFWRHRGAKYCRECNRSVSASEWLSHLSLKSHSDNARNRQREMHNQAINVVPVREPTFRLNAPCSMSEQIQSFRQQVVLAETDCSRIENDIIRDLKPLLLRTFGNCELLTFGSMRSGLALVGSDVDIFVQTCNFRYQENHLSSEHELQSKVHLCSKALCSSTRYFCDINPIFDARVPIVTFMHIPSRTKCDISFTSPLGVEQGRLLHYYLNTHPRFLDVMLVIKYWAKKQGVCNGRDYLSSYGWNFLFICYLQTLMLPDGTNLLPSLYELQSGRGGGIRRVDGCRVDFDARPRSISLPSHGRFSHLGLLEGFFTFYRHFCFQDNVLCPYLGGPVSRRDNPGSCRNMDILLHASRLRSQTNQVAPRFLRVIQDPFNHSAFVVCPSHGLPKIVTCIKQAADICREYAEMEINYNIIKTKFLEKLFSL